MKHLLKLGYSISWRLKLQIKICFTTTALFAKSAKCASSPPFLGFFVLSFLSLAEWLMVEMLTSYIAAAKDKFHHAATAANKE